MNFKSAKEFPSNFLLNNNNNIEVEKCCSSSVEESKNEHHKPNSSNIEEPADSENENQEISEDEFVNYEDDDEQLSSPSNSFNSDVDQQWYEFRGRWMINAMDPNQQPPLLPLDNRPPDNNPPQPQEEEETDFLEMDFEPDTNSEIENEAKGAADYANPIIPPNIDILDQQMPSSRSHNTGAKPKQPTLRTTSNIKHITNNDKSRCYEFREGSSNFINNPLTSLKNSNSPADEYNMGASCSHHDTFRTSKSPSKSSNRSHKQLRLEEERQNDKFLFEIEPLKPTTKNSVTIYTTNCDEKVFIDALTSLNINFNLHRDLISTYFDKSNVNNEQGLVEYLVARSKLNCNYLKLQELFETICKSTELNDGYSDKKFKINFYPLDLFSTTPEMIEIEVNEIVRRWTPQTDLTTLVNIRNKYFYQTNVLGKIVSIIRRINQKPSATFRENETIRIPQFYPSGYITITSESCNNGFNVKTPSI